MADRKLAKSIGEHYVCAVLAQLGWAASLTRDGLARTDILAARAEPGLPRVLVELQVKTSTSYHRHSWMLKEVPLGEGEHEWYVLVAAGDPLSVGTRCFVLPRIHAAAASWIGHHSWLHDPSAKRRRTTPIGQSRPTADDFLGYEERWDLLATPTSRVPVFLPRRMRGESARPEVGLPPGHPWLAGLPPLGHWPGPPPQSR
jgi:hypothetical protein